MGEFSQKRNHEQGRYIYRTRGRRKSARKTCRMPVAAAVADFVPAYCADSRLYAVRIVDVILYQNTGLVSGAFSGAAYSGGQHGLGCFFSCMWQKAGQKMPPLFGLPAGRFIDHLCPGLCHIVDAAFFAVTEFRVAECRHECMCLISKRAFHAAGMAFGPPPGIGPQLKQRRRFAARAF